MKKYFGMMAALTIGMTYSAPAYAIAYCQGQVTNVYTRSNGELFVKLSFAGNYTQICNLQTVWKGVDTQACWGWFAQVNNALMNTRNVLVEYPTIASGQCGTVPLYENAPAPGYVMSL